MKISVPTNHNFFEEVPLTEVQLKDAFGISTNKDLKSLLNKLFTSTLLLTTKNASYTNINIYSFNGNTTQFEDNEQLILKCYSKENEKGDRLYIIQTGLFSGVIFHKGIQFNVTTKYGNTFLQRMLNCITDIYIDTEIVNAKKNLKTNEFHNIVAYLFIQTLEKVSLLGLPKIYQTVSQISSKVRGNIDINHYLKNNIPFIGKLKSSYKEQVYVQEIIDVLYFAAKLLEKTHFLALHKKINSLYELLKSCYSNNYPNLETIKKAKSHISLSNPTFSGFKSALYYAEIIIKNYDLSFSSEDSKTKTSGYLFDISKLFESYLEKLLSRHLTEWNITSQESLTVYTNQFFKRKMFPDLVLRHKKTDSIIVFDAKFKTMKLRSIDLDREDFYQIHSYIQYYSPNVIMGGLLYPLSEEHINDTAVAVNIFDNENIETAFIIDGIFINENMPMHDILTSEEQFLNRITKRINQ